LHASWFVLAQSRACLTFVPSFLTGTFNIYLPFVKTWGTDFCHRFRYGIRTKDSPFVSQAQTNWFLEGAMTQVKFTPPSTLLQKERTQLTHGCVYWAPLGLYHPFPSNGKDPLYSIASLLPRCHPDHFDRRSYRIHPLYSQAQHRFRDDGPSSRVLRLLGGYDVCLFASNPPR